MKVFRTTVTSTLLSLALAAPAFASTGDDDQPAPAPKTNALRRVLLSIDLTKTPDSLGFAKLMAAMTGSVVIDKWVGSCLLNSAMDTASVDDETKTLSATMTMAVRKEGNADCKPEYAWIDKQLGAVLAYPGVKLESTLTDEHD